MIKSNTVRLIALYAKRGLLSTKRSELLAANRHANLGLDKQERYSWWKLTLNIDYREREKAS
jgi:hypothetical protein